MNAVPEGWAIIPGYLDTPNFPFGNLTVDEQMSPVVLTCEPLPISEPEPENLLFGASWTQHTRKE